MDLLGVYDQLLRRHGPQNWWPADTPFEVCVGAILTQNTNWRNVEKAMASLKASNALNPQALAAMPEAELQELIRPAGYYRQKAGRLKCFCQHLGRKYENSLDAMFDKPVTELRAELLSLDGVGPETADSMILYAAEKPSFVIDAYTFRLNDELKLCDLKEKGHEKRYLQLKDYFESNLPVDVELYKEFHALIVAWGKKSQRRKGV